MSELNESPLRLNLQEVEPKKRADLLWRISEIASDYFYLLSLSPDGKITVEWVSGAFSRITGYETEMIKNLESWLGVIDKDDQQEFLKTVQKSLQNLPTKNNYRIKAKNGKVLWLQDKTSPIWDKEASRIINIIGAVQDITKQKNLEQNIELKNAELTDFVYSMSHDVRNCLVIIDGYLSMLEDKEISEVDKKSLIEKIKNIAKKTELVMAHSLKLAEAGLVISNKIGIDVNILFERIKNEFIPNNIVVQIDEFPIIIGDENKMYQIFTNLINNALYHGKPNKITLTFKSDEYFNYLELSNDGTVIPSEIKKKIFQKGFSTKKDHLGHGLSIVEKIVKSHDWEIKLIPEKQTTFQIKIPKENNIV